MSDRMPDGDYVYSDFANDPDMQDLVEMFVHELPGRIEQMESALRDKDIGAIVRVAHQLKGAAGGYGFQVITDDAGDIETLARDHTDFDELATEIRSLSDLCRRARVSPAQTTTPTAG